VKNRVRGVLKARNVDIFSPADLGPAPRDPLLADRLLRKVLKAKAACDGLVLLRLDCGAPIDDWLLDYLSEVRPMRPTFGTLKHSRLPLSDRGSKSRSNSSTIGEIDANFAAFVRESPAALLVAPDIFFTSRSVQFVIPASYPTVVLSQRAG
jgi:hypothetical protein